MLLSAPAIAQNLALASPLPPPRTHCTCGRPLDEAEWKAAPNSAGQNWRVTKQCACGATYAEAETVPALSPISFSMKQCNTCGCVYTHAEWAALPSRRFWQFPDELFEIAECRCGNTMSVSVAR